MNPGTTKKAHGIVEGEQQLTLAWGRLLATVTQIYKVTPSSHEDTSPFWISRDWTITKPPKHMVVDTDFEFDWPKFIWSHQPIIYILGFNTELVSQPGNLPTFKFLDRIFSPSFQWIDVHCNEMWVWVPWQIALVISWLLNFCF